MLFTTKVTEVIGRSTYDPRKTHGVMIEAALRGSRALQYHQGFRVWNKKKFFKEEKGEYVVYIIIMQREKHILSQCNQILPEFNDQSYISSGLKHKEPNCKVLYILLNGLALVLWSSDISA